MARRSLEPIKKDIPCPETNKKPQKDDRRGTITIKSNPIPAGWVANNLENNNTTEVLPRLWWSGFQAWEPNKGTGNPQGIWLWRPAGFDYQDFHRTGENRDSSLGGHKWNLVCSKTQRKGAATPQETEPKLPASVGGSLVESCIGRDSPYGQGDWQQLFGKVPFGVNPLGGCH